MLDGAYDNIALRMRPGTYRIRLATDQDYASIVQVQDEVLARLLAGQRQFVFRRQRDHIQNVLAFAGHVLLAETDEGIFATMLLSDVADRQGYLRALDMDAESIVPMSFTHGGIVMQSLLVHPDYQGNGIAQQMFAAAVQVAKAGGAGFIAMAENRLNKPAITAAFRNEFHINGYGTHSAFGVPGYVFCRQLTRKTAAPATLLKAEDEKEVMALVLSLVANNNQISAIDFQTGAVAYCPADFGVRSA